MWRRAPGQVAPRHAAAAVTGTCRFSRRILPNGLSANSFFPGTRAPLMLLANLEPAVLGQEPWMAFIHLLQRQEPLLVVLEVAEELVRAGHAVPDDAWLSAAAEQSGHWHQYCVLFLSLRRELGACRPLVERAPKGGEMFERIRQRLLESES